MKVWRIFIKQVGQKFNVRVQLTIEISGMTLTLHCSKSKSSKKNDLTFDSLFYLPF